MVDTKTRVRKSRSPTRSTSGPSDYRSAPIFVSIIIIIIIIIINIIIIN